MKYNRFIKCALTKVRRGVSDIEVQRCKNRYIVDAICPSSCKGADEDEVLIILYCLLLLTLDTNSFHPGIIGTRKSFG